MGIRFDRLCQLVTVGYEDMVPNTRFNPYRAMESARRWIKRRKVNARAFAVYDALVHLPSRQGDRVIVAYKRLVELLGFAKGTIIGYVKELEAVGLLLVVPRRVLEAGGSRVTANGYVLLEPPALPEEPRRAPEFGAVLPALVRRVRAARPESKGWTPSRAVPNHHTAPVAPAPTVDWGDALLARIAATTERREKEAREKEARAAALLCTANG